MKKNVIIFLIIILASVIVGFLAYNQAKTQDLENKKDIKEIELSYEDLKELISYVPYDLYNNYNSYENDCMVDKVSEEILIAMALNKLSASECLENADCSKLEKKKVQALEVEATGYYSFSSVKDLVKTMYNKDLENVKETTSWDSVYNSTAGKFALVDGFFLRVGDNEVPWGINHYNLISAYAATTEEIIIFDYAGYGNQNRYAVMDYKTDKEIDTNFNYFDKVFKNYAKNLFIEKRKEFPKYKHIFKKGENGYYWLETKNV